MCCSNMGFVFLKFGSSIKGHRLWRFCTVSGLYSSRLRFWLMLKSGGASLCVLGSRHLMGRSGNVSKPGCPRTTGLVVWPLAHRPAARVRQWKPALAGTFLPMHRKALHKYEVIYHLPTLLEPYNKDYFGKNHPVTNLNILFYAQKLKMMLIRKLNCQCTD